MSEDLHRIISDYFQNASHSPAYHIDVVLLIDATGSMDAIINKAKKAALRIAPMIQERMDKYGKSLETLRIKVISFRDFAFDAEEDAMKESPFFCMPNQKNELADWINKIEARGGGDEPENSLEAICLAMKSAWNTQSVGKRRHVIILFTDAPPVSLEDDSDPRCCLRKRKDNQYYPKDIPKTLAELEKWWNGEHKRGMPEQRTKRMILFAPDEYTWQKIADTFDFVWYIPSRNNNGCNEFDIDDACDVIASCC